MYTHAPPRGKYSDERQHDALQLFIKTVGAIDDTSRFIKDRCFALSQPGLLDTLPCHWSELACDQGRHEEDKR